MRGICVYSSLPEEGRLPCDLEEVSRLVEPKTPEKTVAIAKMRIPSPRRLTSLEQSASLPVLLWCLLEVDRSTWRQLPKRHLHRLVRPIDSWPDASAAPPSS